MPRSAPWEESGAAGRSFSSYRLPQWPEARANLFRKDWRPFPRREVDVGRQEVHAARATSIADLPSSLVLPIHSDMAQSTAGGGKSIARWYRFGLARTPGQFASSNRSRGKHRRDLRLGHPRQRGQLSERKDIGPYPGVEELYLERPIRDWPFLPDKLIHAPVLHGSPAFGVDVDTMIGPGRCSIDLDAKANGLALDCGSQHKVKVAGMKPVGDAAR
jgi:hypothetical protein